MAGEDTTSAGQAAPPRQPLAVAELTNDRLLTLADQIIAATVKLGLPQWFWPEGVALRGMIDVARAAGREFPADVVDYLRGFPADAVTIDHVNNLAPGVAALLAEQAGALLPSRLVDRLAAWVTSPTSATFAPNGALEHWPGGVWADTVYMAGSFLGALGAVRGQPGRVDQFGRQLLAHYATLQHPGVGLCAHGSHAGQTIWCFWGRANAWLALASVDYLRLTAMTPAADQELAAAVRPLLTRQLAALVGCQPQHGVWSVLVDDQAENAGILETSAAAGIGAAMLSAGEVLPDGPAEFAEAGLLAVSGALAYVNDGILTRVSAGTVLQLVPFGYSVIRDDRPQLYGQGLALQAIAALLRRT